MAYTPDVFADDEAGNTPITAEKLNRLGVGLQVTAGVADAAETPTGAQSKADAAQAAAVVVATADATAKANAARAAAEATAAAALTAGLAGKANTADITALDGRVDVLEAAPTGTSVPDGSVTEVKLAAEVAAKLNAASRDLRRFDIRAYGAKVDGVKLLDAVPGGSGTTSLSSPTYTFTSADVGKIIGVELPIGGFPDAHVTTIASVAGGVATLATAFPATVAAGPLEAVFGTNDDAAVAAAQAAAVAAGGGTVWIPPGRTCVQASLKLANGVSWRGEGRSVSVVASIKQATSATVSNASWLYTGAVYPGSPLIDATFRDFKIEGRMHTNTLYSSATKPFNLYIIQRVFVSDMWLDRTPTTSIPCDVAIDCCIISNNLITYPGRMNDGTSPGGSGIGMGTKSLANSEPSLVIGNTIIGDGQRGVNGIFTESQLGGSASSVDMSVGYRIVGNYIRGMRYGITGAGSAGLVITGNFIESCYSAGIALNGGTLTGGSVDNDFLISGNVIWNSVTTGAPITTDGHGILIDIHSQVGHQYVNQGRGLIVGNSINRCRGNGILVVVGDTSTSGLSIRGNTIRQNGWSGIAFKNAIAGTGVVRRTVIEGNTLASNGTRSLAGDSEAILIGNACLDCQIISNSTYDDQATKTQAFGIRLLANVVFTGGAVRGNGLRTNKTGAVTLGSGASWGVGAIVSGNEGYSIGGGTPAVVTVAASPFTYTAGVGPETVYVTGGTVTSITKGGVTLASGSERTFRLEPAEALVITYSVAPTVTADRH